MKHSPVLLLTEGDPWGAPTGGQTTFAKHLLTAFGPRLSVSSHCDDETIPLGQWIQRSYAGEPIWFLNRGSVRKRKDKKPFVPARIRAYFKARQFMPQVREKVFTGLIIDSPEMLFAASSYKWPSVCYSFAGVNNPVANSRYPWARVLGRCFEQYFVSCLKRVNPETMIAAADHAAIAEFFNRTDDALDRSRFHHFPTRVDTDFFHPIDVSEARKYLNIPLDAKVFVAIGRLCWIKGWDLLLDVLVHIKQDYANPILIFVGDGEDHAKLQAYAKRIGVYENIRITGLVAQSDVVRYMNAADVCLVGSHREGWSLAMCEMIACGKSVVSTDVSGARDMVKDGLNGYVQRRNPHAYAEAIHRAMNLERAAAHSLEIAKKYAVKNLARELGALWAPLRKA